jgi:hypothetical protein
MRVCAYLASAGEIGAVAQANARLIDATVEETDAAATAVRDVLRGASTFEIGCSWPESVDVSLRQVKVPYSDDAAFAAIGTSQTARAKDMKKRRLVQQRETNLRPD